MDLVCLEDNTPVTSTMNSYSIPAVNAIAVLPEHDETPEYYRQQHSKTISSASPYEQSEVPTTAYFAIDGQGSRENGDHDSVVSATIVHGVGQGGFKNGGLKQCQDVFWAVLFYLHLFGITAVLCYNISNDDNIVNIADADYGSIVWLVVVTSAAAVTLSTLALGWMMVDAVLLIKTALAFSVISSLAIAILGWVLGIASVAVLGIFAFAIGCFYAIVGKGPESTFLWISTRCNPLADPLL
jgi:hypothetical protein